MEDHEWMQTEKLFLLDVGVVMKAPLPIIRKIHDLSLNVRLLLPLLLRVYVEQSPECLAFWQSKGQSFFPRSTTNSSQFIGP